MSVTAHKETHAFQAEVNQLLHLVVHSLYSNKDIFLRELISNSSDALDKLRVAALHNEKLYENDPNLLIRVDVDKEKRTISVTDNGIGMNREEISENLGTIAKSGTQNFLKQLSGDEAKDSQLIGQFGVGFYSSYIVADKATVLSRRAGENADQGVRWTSDGKGEFTIENIDKPSRGTTVILHLKESDGIDEYLEPWRLRSIINTYSDHISFPIEMQKIATPAEEAAAEEEAEEKAQDNEAVKKEQQQKDKAPEYEKVNKATALWTRPKSDITDEEYKEFYKHISHDFEDPLLWTHNRVEGKQQYISLLYVPKHAPFDLWMREQRHGLKLFVQRVFIMDDAEQFMPFYLRFIKGVVDSNDLPLNISREILQSNRLVDAMRQGMVKRVLSLLEKLARDDKEKYAEFWQAFGKVLKEGPAEDFSNRERIAKLLRFASTHNDTDKQDVTLEDYVKRMKEGQDKIYYVIADSFTAAQHSPHLEIFRKKGIEVLLMSDRVDEWLVSHLTEFDGKQLQSVAKGSVDLGESEEEKTEEEKKQTQEDFASFIKQAKEILGEKVKDVRITNRLTESPACIVADDMDASAHMQRLLQAAGQEIPKSKPIFEINPEHQIIARLKNEADDERFAEWINVLFEQSVLAEGGQLDDPAGFVARLNQLLLHVAV